MKINVNLHALAVDIGIAFLRTLIRDTVIELHVVAIITKISSCFSIAANNFYFLYIIFFD